MHNNQSPRLSPLLPPTVKAFTSDPSPSSSSSPTVCGLPLKYLSLITLAVQNAALSIVMHYSRVSTSPELSYSPASAVLLNEVLKGSISFSIALYRAATVNDTPRHPRRSLLSTFSEVCGEIFSPDCWKLSIPAMLYVIQNSLQFVAISNLPVATFQVTYQMKILTTAAFSVALLRKKLSTTKWLSLFFLAIGVGIVQIQSSTSSAPVKDTPVGSAHEFNVHVMDPMKGFAAVTAACFTSGLAGVYFEMVLKGSKANLWVRNVQLSLFSLIPALLPILYAPPLLNSQGFVMDLFRNFGAWAWATVSIQVFGGLITAVVIKYSDNIMKGFATSLSIVLSFLASVVLFEFRITLSFVIGASTVLAATWMYNQPPGKEVISIVLTSNGENGSGMDKKSILNGGIGRSNGTSAITSDIPLLGQMDSLGLGKRKNGKVSPFASPRIIASALGLGSSDSEELPQHNPPTPQNQLLQPTASNTNLGGYFGDTMDTSRYHHAPYGSPWPSRPPSRIPSRTPTPCPPESPQY